MRLIVDLTPCDPQWGLAVEEALFESLQVSERTMVRVWINRPAVIVGRSQSVQAEVDEDHAIREGIPILRRISGGGTVYHYAGNLNVSVFLAGLHVPDVGALFRLVGGSLTNALSTRDCTLRVIENGIYGEGQKIGGAAQARRSSAVLCHTTLLLHPPPVAMERYLRALRPGYSPQGVPSRPQRTASLSELLGYPLREADVTSSVVRALEESLEDLAAPEALTDVETARASALVEGKYGCEAWTYRR